jgi:hypothetical protein
MASVFRHEPDSPPLSLWFASSTWLEWLDLIFGLLILADFCARLYVSPHPVREFAHPSTWADMVAIFSFLAPVVGEGLGRMQLKLHSRASDQPPPSRFRLWRSP